MAHDEHTSLACPESQKTIKVWDAGDRFFAPQRPLGAPLTPLPAPLAGTLELKAEKQNAHAAQYGESIKAVQFSPDGTKIVSCGVDKTIKVWDSGASNGHS